MRFLFNVFFSSLMIAIAAKIAERSPRVAGFVIALPLASILVLALSYVDSADRGQSVEFARSIFVAIPVSLLFFLPFLVAERLQLGFWTCWASGLGLLVIGYFVHRSVLA